MRASLPLFASLSVAIADPFATWAESHGKHFSNNWEEAKHRAAFAANSELVDRLNREGDGATYSLDGPWADLSPTDFATRLMPERVAPAALSLVRERAIDAVVPDSFDWVAQGAVAPIRDQGSLGTCWAVSTAENVEGQVAIATGKLVPMSVEQLVECDASSDATCDGDASTKGGCADCGVFGGWPYLAYQYIQKAGGLFSEADFPYWTDGMYPCMATGYSTKMCGNHESMYCNKSTTKGQGPGGLCEARSGFAAKLSGWKSLSTDEEELAAQLVQYGPISVLIKASGMQMYKKGIWKGGLFGCKPDGSGLLGLDHAVLLVGFGTDGSTPYWKVKNSWGQKWGEQGYVRILRGSGTCGINLAATTAQVSASVVV